MDGILFIDWQSDVQWNSWRDGEYDDGDDDDDGWWFRIWIDLNRTIEMAAMWKIMTITTRVE